MAIHDFWLSSEVTMWNTLKVSDPSSREEVIEKLSNWKYHLSTPRQAFDLLSNILPTLRADWDIEFYLWILYVVWEYLRWNDEYDESNLDWYHHMQNAVNSARNRKWIISNQVLQILDNPKERVTITGIDFKALSQTITNFVVHTESREDRRKLQTIKNVLLDKLWLDWRTDWTIILNTIQLMTEKKQRQKEAA